MKPQTNIKQINQKKLLLLLLTKQATNRTDLAKRSGLTKMTVTNLINEWISDDFFVEKKEAADLSRGRPKMILELSAKAPKVLGVQVTKSSIALSLSNLYGVIEDSWTKAAKQDEYETAIDELLNKALAKYINTRFLSLAIVFTDIHAPRELIDHIEQKINIPVVTATKEIGLLSHEFLFGQIRGKTNALLFHLSDQINTAALLDGQISKHEPNLAHLSIDYNGLTCACGRKGCLCAYIAKPVMEKKLRDISKLKMDFAGFCQLQNKKNDSKIDWALKDMSEKLGHGLANVCTIMGINTVILSGEATYIPDRYLTKLEKDLQSELKDLSFSLLKTSLTQSEQSLLPIDVAIYSYLN